MSNFTKYSDIYDPEVIVKIVGEQWLNDPILTRAGIIMRDARQTQGTLTTTIRQTTFQNRKAQALKAGDTISSTNKFQEGANNPILWRYDSIEIPDVIGDIEVKDKSTENANMAESIRIAAAQAVDDSGVAVLEGIAGSLTDNQTDESGSGDISLPAINNAKKKTLDKKNQLNGGGIVMHSKVYYDAVALGLVSNSTNTFGNAAQDRMVINGQLPETILGLTPIVTDKLALSGSDYLTYLVGMNTLILRGNSAPNVELQRAYKAKMTATNYDVTYGMGVAAMKWTLAGAEDIDDDQLADSANWVKATNAPSNSIAIYRLQTT